MRQLLSFTAVALIVSLAGAPASADPIYASFTSTAAGSLNGDSFTISGYNGTPSLVTQNLSGANYSAAPGSASQSAVQYGTNSGFTITFSSAITDLFFADVFFRGPSSGVSTPTYTFDQSFSIASGNSAASLSGDSLVVSTSSYASGFLEFAGPITSLTLTSNTTTGQFQAFTLALNPAAVPEPSSLVLCGIAGLVAVVSRRALRKRMA